MICPKCGKNTIVDFSRCGRCGYDTTEVHLRIVAQEGGEPRRTDVVTPTEAGVGAMPLEVEPEALRPPDGSSQPDLAKATPWDDRFLRDPLDGVAGWLKLFVVGNLLLVPISVVITYILAWIGAALLARDDPKVILLLLISTSVDGCLTYIGIQVGRRLGDIAPRAVQEARRFLGLRLGWALLSPLLVSFFGLDVGREDVEESVVDTLIALIAITIWFLYFKVSKRVKATYPDWNA